MISQYHLSHHLLHKFLVFSFTQIPFPNPKYNLLFHPLNILSYQTLKLNNLDQFSFKIFNQTYFLLHQMIKNFSFYCYLKFIIITKNLLLKIIINLINYLLYLYFFKAIMEKYQKCQAYLIPPLDLYYLYLFNYLFSLKIQIFFIKISHLNLLESHNQKQKINQKLIFFILNESNSIYLMSFYDFLYILKIKNYTLLLNLIHQAYRYQINPQIFITSQISITFSHLNAYFYEYQMLRHHTYDLRHTFHIITLNLICYEIYLYILNSLNKPKIFLNNFNILHLLSPL